MSCYYYYKIISCTNLQNFSMVSQTREIVELSNSLNLVRCLYSIHNSINCMFELSIFTQTTPKLVQMYYLGIYKGKRRAKATICAGTTGNDHRFPGHMRSTMPGLAVCLMFFWGSYNFMEKLVRRKMR